MKNWVTTLIGSIVAGFTYVFLYAPIVVMVVYSFNTRGFPSQWEGFTLAWYYELFRSPDMWSSLLVSSLVATLSVTLSLTLGALLIFYHSSGANIRKGLGLFYANLVFPETVLGIALMSYFFLLRIPLGIQTLIAAHTILGTGFVIPVLYMRYKQLDPRLLEASYSLGATHVQTFFRVILPILRPSMIASGLMIFVLSFDDFALSYFCAGTHVQTLSLHLLSMIRVGIQPTMNALTTILLIFSSGLVMIFYSPRVRSRLF